MSLSVVTLWADGTGRQVLNLRGPVSGLQFTSALPGGDTACQFSIAIDAGANPAALSSQSVAGTPRIVEIYDSTLRVWKGVLADAQRGTPWQVAGQGLSSLSDRYVALDGSGNVSTDPATAVNAAITRGLPWTNLITLNAPSSPIANATGVGSLLDASSTAAGMYWGVDQNGQTFQAVPTTTPTLLMVASNTLGDRTVDQFASDEYVRYTPPQTVTTTTSGSGSPTTVAALPTVIPAPNNPASGAARPFGRWERLDDISGSGAIATTAAQAYGNGQLALQQPRATFAGSLTVQPGDLRTLGGQPVRLSTIRAGQMVKIVGVQPDPATAEQVFSLAVNVVIGQWTYLADSDTATMSALGAPARPTLAAPVAAA